MPATYQIKDLADTDIKGQFYEDELIPSTKPDFYLVDKIIKTRIRKGNKEFLVSWKNFDEKHNSWVKSEDIIQLNKHYGKAK